MASAVTGAVLAALAVASPTVSAEGPPTPPVPPQRTETPTPAQAPGPRPAWPPPVLAFEAGTTGHTDLLLLPGARRPGARPSVVAATRVAARPAAIAGILLNPAAMREALPALVRADVVATRPGPRPDAWPDRLIAWEVEIPLFNLSGRAWLHQHDDGAELSLVEGAFAPGHARFRLAASPSGGGTIATCELTMEARSANWMFRRVANHDPWSESAIAAATSWVLLRAVAQRAEAAPGSASARPTGPIAPPPATRLDGAFLGAAALAPLRAAGTVAGVRRATGGRLAWASVAVPVAAAPAVVGGRLAQPETWGVFPGWHSVKRRAATTTGSPLLIEVEDNIPFVDFDAVWSVNAAPPAGATTRATTRVTAIEGDLRGAVFTWQTGDGDAPGTSLAILSTHPRLDAAGYIERKMIAAEPLLEHAFAVALAYVNAAAVADSLRP